MVTGTRSCYIPHRVSRIHDSKKICFKGNLKNKIHKKGWQMSNIDEFSMVWQILIERSHWFLLKLNYSFTMFHKNQKLFLVTNVSMLFKIFSLCDLPRNSSSWFRNFLIVLRSICFMIRKNNTKKSYLFNQHIFTHISTWFLKEKILTVS